LGEKSLQLYQEICKSAETKWPLRF
jgi:hypothetical protein